MAQLVPCRSCARPILGAERSCPFCDQFHPRGTALSMVVASVLAAGCPTEDEDTNDVASVPGEASYGTVESDDGGWLTEEPDCTEATSGAEASTDDGARAIPEPEGHAELVD